MNCIIPKKTKVKNTVWRSWGLVDIFVALVLFVIVFVLLSTSHYVWCVIMLLITVGVLIPTQDGIVYMILWGMIKYLISPREYGKMLSGKKSMTALFPLSSIKKSGLIKYTDNTYARVIHIGQKNFGILSVENQDSNIITFAEALKCLNLTQRADLVKVERAVNLEKFTESLERRIANVEDAESDTKETRLNILRDRKEQLDMASDQRQHFTSEFYIVIYGRNKNDLESTSLSVASQILQCGLSATILGGPEAACFIKNTFTRNFDAKEAIGKTSKELVDWATPKKVTFTAHGAKVDGISQSAMTLTDYPLEVHNGWGDGIFNIPDTKVVMHIRPVENSKAIKRIDKCVSDSEVKSITAEKASESAAAETHRNTMLNLLDALQNDNEVLLDTTIVVTVYNHKEDNMTAARLDVKRKLSQGGFKTSNLYAMQQQGFMLSCPAPYDKFTNYDRGINSTSLAAIFPFVRSYLADDDGIMLGTAKIGGYPFILNIWKRGALFQNSNAMIVGKSGSGKSFFMKSFLTGEWSQGTRMIILDPENEYNDLTKNLGGCLIDVGNSKEGRINPFHIYRILTDEGTPAEPAVTFNTHLKTLESFYQIVLAGISSVFLEIINNLTIDAYTAKGIDEATDCSDFTPEMFPTFTDLFNVVEKKKKEEQGEYTPEELHTVEMYLKKFVSGRYSDIWNGPSTLNTDSEIVDFNFQSLFANKNNIVANAQMLLVFRYAEQEVINGREKFRHGVDVKTLILVDEAHMFIDEKYPIALDFFYSMCKRIRKYNGAFIPATQNISDWTKEALVSKSSAIIKNSQYMFVFKLASSDVTELQKLYESGDGFNKYEQNEIINAPTGETFFIGSTEFRTSMNVHTSPYVVSLFGEKNRPGDAEP